MSDDQNFDVDLAVTELRAAGWVAERFGTIWRAPDGVRWRGPAGAWRVMCRQRNEARERSWAVTVERNGEQVVTLSSNGMGGRDLSVEDERVIRLAADHLLAFLGARAVDSPTWLPIETAPKDGTRVLVFDKSWCGGRSRCEVSSWLPYKRCDGDVWAERGSWSGVSIATHWMPLPSAPVAFAAQGFSTTPNGTPARDAVGSRPTAHRTGPRV